MRRTAYRFGCSATEKDIESVMLNSRAYNVIFDGFDSPVSMNSSFVKEFPKMFANVKRLTFKNCDIIPAVFTAMVLQCKKLMHLNVTGCNSLFMTGLLLSKKEEVDQIKGTTENIKVLSLSYQKYLSDRILNRIFSICPTVCHLGLAGNSIIFHSSDYYKGIHCKGEACEETANSAVLTFANIIKFISNHSSAIKVLNFSRTLMNCEALGTMVTIEKLQLCELYLSCCQEISDSAILSICKNQPLLSVLDVSECVSITDRGVIDICKNLCNLKTLLLAKCRQITQQSVCQLHNLNQLERLDMSSCSLITTNGLKLGLCTGTVKNLTYLKIVACCSVHDSFAIEASRHLQHLTHLDLSSCKIGDLSVVAFSYRLLNLENLCLAWCQDITDDGLLGTLDPDSPRRDSWKGDGDCDLCRCTRQHHLIPCKTLPLPDPPGGLVCHRSLTPEELVPISHLRRLKTLDLTSCRKLTDKSITEVVNFPQLKKLHLGLMPQITDASLFAIARNVPALEELALPQCGRITDSGIKELARKLRRLSLLNVSNCDLLSNQSVEALFGDSKGLRHLDVSLCGNITREAVEMLENNLKHLVTVHKRHVGTKASLHHCHGR